MSKLFIVFLITLVFIGGLIIGASSTLGHHAEYVAHLQRIDDMQDKEIQFCLESKRKEDSDG